MRFFLALGTFAFLASGALDAQEPGLPVPEAESPKPAQSNSPGPAVSASPAPELIPPEVLGAAERVASPAASAPALPPVSQLDEAFKEKPISTGAEAAQRRAEWRELRNRVANDAEVKAARRTAEAAGTDLEKRTLLRAYYELYFGKMIALAADPALKSYLNDRKNEHLATLPQPRVRPTPTPTKSRG